MNAKSLILILITAGVIYGAWTVSKSKAPKVEVDASALYPGLIDRINDVTAMTMKSNDHAVRLVRSGEQWVIENRDNFPAKFENVKQAILRITEARILEQKTSVPEKYDTLGVSDPTEGDGEGVRLDLEGTNQEQLVSLIVGKERDSKAIGRANYYVRRVGEAPSYLVEGELEFDAKVTEWLDRDIVDIDTSRVHQVTITPTDADPIVLKKGERSANFFEIQDIPAGFKAKSRTTVSSLGGVLLGVRFDDVAAVSHVSEATPRSVVEVQTFDGLVATLNLYDYNDKAYVGFGFRFDESVVVAEEEPESEDETSGDAADESEPKKSVAQEAAELNQSAANWIYVLPDYKTRMIEKRLGDLIEAIEDEPETSE